jgi:serine/threonine protein kinase
MAAPVNETGADISPTNKLDKLKKHLANESGSGTHLAYGYQASVELVETSFGNYVIKRARGPLLWRRLGEAALKREREIYDRLVDVPGVPRCIGLLDEKHLVLEHVPGKSYRQHQPILENKEQFFSRLLTTLQTIHAAGVAHGDLKRKDNLIVGPDEQPFVIDFGLACLRNESGKRLNAFFFEWTKQYDYNAWIKHKYDRRVENIAAEDAGYYRPMKLELIARKIRIVWQTATLRRLRKRRRQAANERRNPN